MIQKISNDMKEQIEKSLDAYKRHLAAIRTGRAHTGLLDGVKVDYYGIPTPVAQMATITTPDARTLFIKPFEKGQQKAIEKAILEANLGLNAVTDGDAVRVPVPALNEERRKEFVKQAKHRAEEAKLAVRNARRDANEHLKEAAKKGMISEDEEKRAMKVVQDSIDEVIHQIDQILVKKEQEIMTV